MDWINAFRLKITDELECAAVQLEVMRNEYEQGRVAYEAARLEHDRMADLLHALNQIDPTTAVPEPPL